MAFSTVPSPLYVLYQERDGFSQLAITVIFAAYAVGVMVSLFLAGHLSDLFGRRRILLVGLAINALVGLVFIAGTGLTVLLLARFICGIAVGMVTGTATAYLAELYSKGSPHRDRSTSDAISGTAPMLGLGAGALLAGALAQFAPWPLHTPYLLFAALFAVAAVSVQAIPETVVPKKGTVYRIRGVRLPHHARSRFMGAAGMALTAFALLALFSSVAPGFVAGTLHLGSRALAGAVTFAVYVAGALSPLVMTRAPLHRLLSRGFACLGAGLVIFTVGVWLASFALFVAGGVLVGAGAGLLFKGCVSTVVGLASPESRAETLAGLFLMAYIGLSMPIVAFGIVSRYLTATNALIGFALLFLVVTMVVRRRLLVPALADYNSGGVNRGSTFSVAKPNAKSSLSRQAGPSISRPTGKPELVSPAGSDKPGIPATDAGLVLRM